MSFLKKKTLGKLSRLFNWQYTHCMCCGITWYWVAEHITRYNELCSLGPICESCWKELATPEKRMPYYREEWAERVAPFPEYTSFEDWDVIRQAVERDFD